MFTVHVGDSRNLAIPLPGGLTLKPVRWTHRRIGGPYQAEINVTGPEEGLRQLLQWLRFGIEIRDDAGQPLWWGYVHAVEVPYGRFRLSKSLDMLHNRVAVAYTYEGDDNEQMRGTTEWVQDARSVSQYGTRELLYPQVELSEDAASDLAATLLDRFSQPRRELRPAGGITPTARLDCMGWWHDLSCRYYANDAGREVNDVNGAATQVLGVGCTRAYISFEKANRRVHGVGSSDHGFKTGNKVVISGSGSNNGTKTITSATGQTSWDYTASTISFNDEVGDTNDIYDSAQGFGALREGNIIQIIDSASNDGVYAIDDIEEVGGGEDYDHLEVSDTVETAGAGDSMTLRRDGYFAIDTPVVDADAGPSVTVTAYGAKIAQSFSLEFNETWSVDELLLRISKTGSPADNVKVAIQADAGGNPSGTDLVSAQLAASEFGDALAWEVWDLGGTWTPSYGSTYWIVVSRTGSNDPDDYYELAVDEELAYSRGALKVYDGSAWQTRPTNADMPFQLWGHEDTATQIVDIIDSFYSEYSGLRHVTCMFTSYVEKRQWREGDQTAQDEIEELIEIGFSGATMRYIITVTPSREVLIERLGVSTTQDYRYLTHELHLTADGRILWPTGTAMRPGESCAGYYMQMDDAQAVEALEAPLRFVVDRCEFDAISGLTTPYPMDSMDPYDWGRFYEK